LTDEDDEVRDRASLILASFDQLDEFPVPNYQEEEHIRDGKFLVIDEPLQMSFTAMERSMKAYMEYPTALQDTSKPLTFATLPVIEDTYLPPPLPAVRAGGKKKTTPAVVDGEGSSAAGTDPSSVLYRIPQFASYGRAFHASKEIPLTETEMEYVVTCIKHIFASHIVLQFSVLNTIDDQRLKNLTVKVDFSESEEYTVEHVIPAPLVRYGEHANTYVSLIRNGDPVAITLDCEMSFRVVQVDPNTGIVPLSRSADVI
jgi:coatomer protein complex subunit gamma